MTRQVGIIVGVFAALAVLLGVTVAAAIAFEDGGGMMDGGDGGMMDGGSGGMMDGGSGGMMDGANGGMMDMMMSMPMDAASISQMFDHMREVLGDDAFNRMMQHFDDQGAATDGNGVDAMMHRMMGEMMRYLTPGAGQPTPTPSASN
jgi:hypothetical protein